MASIFGNSADMNEIEEGLFLGNCFAARAKTKLQACGIRHIVQAAEELGSPPFPADFEYTVVNVVDYDTENIGEHFDRCIAAISKAREQGQGVLVHCAMGISRSSTIVIAYLMATRGMTLATAFDLVKAARPIICPNPGFRKELMRFEVQLLAEGKELK
eukprot:TRINITY_DN20940_c0_g1_i1.p2 TRINITY_DN20940_c0_g1~~TRINITY_DN20940_c0_g1_i1.p2  ORF type:complete len:159 (+),score=40.68 TRINITY_DN20940_c0_g1_i1:486-962(+)